MRAPLLFGALGALLILIGTSRYGVGLTPDSALYLGVAENRLPTLLRWSSR